MSSTGPKQAIYENLAEVAQALGHAHRLELLEHLAQGIRSVEELSARAHLTFANTSRHLQILRRARLVETERRGKHVLYRLAGESEVVALTKALGRVGEKNMAEIGRVVTDYFQARDALEPVSRDDLVARLHDDLVTVLDVRPGSPAAQQGIRRGDILVGMHIWETISLENMAYILERDDLAKLDSIVFYIIRGNDTLYGHMRLAARTLP